MNAYIRILHPDGSLHPANYTADSLADAARYEPADGVYTVANTFRVTNVLKMNAHLDRLEDSARRADIALRYDRAQLRAALRACILDYNKGDVRWRVTVGKDQPDQLIITLEPFTPIAPALIENGVRVVTVEDAVRANAAAKTTGWMHQRGAYTPPAGIYETILLDSDGAMLEGLSSNFYAIRDGVLYTSPADVVLPGISRLIALEVAAGIIPVTLTAPHINERHDEAFITSASRGIVPVIEINGTAIGDGTPGPLTRQLRAAYQAWIEQNLEAL